MPTYRNHKGNSIFLSLSQPQICIPLLYSHSFSIIADCFALLGTDVYQFAPSRISIAKGINRTTDNAQEIHAGNSNHAHLGVLKGVGLTTQLLNALQINAPSAPQQQSQLIAEHSAILCGNDQAHVLVAKMLQLKQGERTKRNKKVTVKETASDHTTSFKGYERSIRILQQPIRSFTVSMFFIIMYQYTDFIWSGAISLPRYLQVALFLNVHRYNIVRVIVHYNINQMLSQSKPNKTIMEPHQRISPSSHSRSFLRPNSFHTFSCWSPAPVARNSPLGLRAQYSTLFWCPWIVSCLFPYKFHITIWLRENPWHDTISGLFMEATRPQTCDPVSIYFVTPYPSFQNFSFLSAVPPPLTSDPNPTHVSALTAAPCVQLSQEVSDRRRSYKSTQLSLPPLARRLPQALTPQIYCEWSLGKVRASLPMRSSMQWSRLSLEPLKMRFSFQSMVAILPECMQRDQIPFSRRQSQIWKLPSARPNAMQVDVGENLMADRSSLLTGRQYRRQREFSNSSPRVMLQKQRSFPTAAQMKLEWDQSSRLLQQLSDQLLTLKVRTGYFLRQRGTSIGEARVRRTLRSRVYSLRVVFLRRVYSSSERYEEEELSEEAGEVESQKRVRSKRRMWRSQGETDRLRREGGVGLTCVGDLMVGSTTLYQIIYGSIIQGLPICIGHSKGKA